MFFFVPSSMCVFCVMPNSTYVLQGTAEVIFARRGDAVAALRKYNNVQLDGKPMKIEILGTNTPTAPAALPTNNGTYARNVAKRYVRFGALLICGFSLLQLKYLNLPVCQNWS